MRWKIDPKSEQIVLLPFDFSPAGIDALPTARDMVSRTELLWVLHVIAPISITSPAALMGETTPEELHAHADTELAKVLRDAGLGEAQRRIVVGDPASAIVDVAKEIDAALIVIPSHGKTGVRRWMIGSVAERVVRQTPCPVLVLPIRGEQEHDS